MEAFKVGWDIGTFIQKNFVQPVIDASMKIPEHLMTTSKAVNEFNDVFYSSKYNDDSKWTEMGLDKMGLLRDDLAKDKESLKQQIDEINKLREDGLSGSSTSRSSMNLYKSKQKDLDELTFKLKKAKFSYDEVSGRFSGRSLE